MKKSEVQVGQEYRAKVSGTVVTVLITGESRYGGWDAVNVATKRKVRIKSPARLRGPADPRPAKRKVVASAAEALAGQDAATAAQDRPSGKAAGKHGRQAEALQTAAKVASKVLGIPVGVVPPKATSAATAAQDRPSGKAAGKGKSKAKDATQADTGERGATGAGPKPLSDVERRAIKAEPPSERSRRAKAAKQPKAKKPSGLDAAAQVLAEAGEPLGAKEMVERMLAKGLWTTQGKTPAATIYAAIIRQIADKGEASRFRKVERGRFTVAK